MDDNGVGALILGNHHIVIILHKKSNFEVVFVVGES